MNQLTWVMYFADVLPHVGAMFIIITIALAALAMVIAVIIEDGKHLWFFVPIIFFTLFVSVVIPSRETILLMAGSQLGEQIVQTPQAKELLDGIQQVIKAQLEAYTKKDTK